MDNHPIENLMRSTMESIKDMIDVNTIVGDPIESFRWHYNYSYFKSMCWFCIWR